MLIEKLVHSWEGLSARYIINFEYILEGVHLQRNIFAIQNKCTILQLVLFCASSQEVCDIVTLPVT